MRILIGENEVQSQLMLLVTCSLFTLQLSHISTIFYPIRRCIFVRMTRTIVGLYQLNIIDLFLAQVTAQNDNLRVKQGIPCFMRNLASSVDQLHGCWMALRVAQYDCHLMFEHIVSAGIVY